jgi:AraC-like DNA-binding protein
VENDESVTEFGKMARLHIKNMVCPRCITSVKKLLNEQEIGHLDVQLGEVVLTSELSPVQKIAFQRGLEKRGFQLLEDYKSQLISKIKSIIVEEVHYSIHPLKVNFSTLLSDHLHQEYSSLSRLFSTVEGITIEKYILAQKTERIKELIVYNELSLSEIAFQMNYSSVAHLSTQFKKETGMTPTTFRQQTQPNRKPLDAM